MTDTATIYIIVAATTVLDIKTNGITNIHAVKKYAPPVIIPRINATRVLSFARSAKYWDAVIDMAADMHAIIAVNIIVYCPAPADTNPITNPNVDTNASCIPKTIDAHPLYCRILFPVFYINIPPFCGGMHQECFPILPCWGVVTFFDNRLFVFPQGKAGFNI